jgi:DNA polymerase V
MCSIQKRIFIHSKGLQILDKITIFNHMFALVDCNNFYVSCERVFQPKLENSPVVILSNNDGCVISRSNEAKNLGIPMGAPAFKYLNLFKKKQVNVFSSNYPLYGDMSQRIMKILSMHTPNIEIYSIDEAFLDFRGFKYCNLEKEALLLKQKIKRWTGIPVSIGIAPTKALAKIANKIGKKYVPKTRGVYLIKSEKQILNALKWTKVEDIWGIGRQYKKLLLKKGVATANDFCKLSDQWVKKNMSILGLRLKEDLKGYSCIGLDEKNPDKKSISTTRSFKEVIKKYWELEERVVTYASICSQKLRRQNSNCKAIIIFIRTSSHLPANEQYYNSSLINLPNPTNSAITIAKYANMGLRRIFKKNINYKKAGVILTELTPSDSKQLNLFQNTGNTHGDLMKIIDKIHLKFGKSLLKLGNQDLNQTWKMRQEYLSSRYTTDVKEIIKVK